MPKNKELTQEDMDKIRKEMQEILEKYNVKLEVVHQIIISQTKPKQ